ncbi:MAG: HlyD family efflux transporter periplasmic adaptor subunit [Gammaproteobacteria bacterium]|nr:HlyD family efflux transporter periplasmic adaptor subunit [Gammaproteobacteria bacterium]
MSMGIVRCILFCIPLGIGLTGCSSDNQEQTGANVPPVPYAAMANGWVDVEGGLVHIGALRDGVVQEVRVQEGDAVSRDQVLAMLDPRQARINVALVEAELKRLAAQARLLEAKLSKAERHAARIAAAVAENAASVESEDEARSGVAELKAEIAAADAATEAARQRLLQARYELELNTIRAPFSGLIVRRTVQVGQSLSMQNPNDLFQLLPDRPRIVRAALNEDFVDRVHPGMSAEVVPDSQGDKIYSARVLRISEVFGPSRPVGNPDTRAGMRDVESVLELPPGTALRIGQHVLVRFKP